MNKKKNKKKKLTDKQLILISCGITFSMFVVLFCFIFRDNIFPKHVEHVDWGEVTEEGEISLDDELYNQTEEIDEFTDENGLLYERKNIYAKGISIYLPKNWEANTENQDIIYLSNSEDKDFNTVEIAITTRQIDIANPDNLAQNMIYFNKNLLTYHYEEQTFTFPTYQINTQMLNKLYDPNHQVWVDVSDTALYTEAETLDNESDGSWEQRNKFLGVTETGSLNSFNDNSSMTANVAYNFYYMLKDNTEYFIAVMGLTDQAEKVDTVAQTIRDSFEFIEPLEDIYLPSFGNTQTLGNVKFKYPTHFEEIKNADVKRFEANNFNSKDYGIGISAYTVNFGEEDYVTTDMQNWTDYKYQFIQTLTNNIGEDLFYSNYNETVMSSGNEEEVTVGSKTCLKYDVSMFVRTIGGEIDMKLGRSLPMRGIAYLFEDGEKMHVIILTYSDGLENVAQKYASALEKTFTIS